MRNELLEEMCMVFQQNGIYTEELKNKMVILLSEYDVNKRMTEVAVYHGDVNKQLLTKFLMSKTVAGCTKRTLGFYQNELSKILEKIGKAATEITPDDIRLYLAIRQAKDGVSRTTASNEWRALSSFYAWLQREEIVLKNPMNRVESIKPEKKKKKAFSEMEVEKIREGTRNLRDKALVEVMFSTWCRISELAGMKISDIEGNSMTVLGKGRKERVVYLNSKAMLALDKYIKSRDDGNDALFVSLQKPHETLDIPGIGIAIRGLGRRLGIENCHPHRFRRTGATMALRSGMPIAQVSQILGHESVATTQIYLDISEKEARQAHEKYVK